VSDRLRAAAEATEGELLWYGGRPARTFHSQHCGGITESARDVWPDEDAPYLRSREDSFCVAQTRFEWQARVAAADLSKALGSAEMRVLERNESGRVARIAAGGRVLAPESLRQALGWDKVRSAFFEVQTDSDAVVFRGHGSGHGVGLCQIGALRRGEAGHDYRAILDFYYPGAVLGVGAAGFAWTRLGGERVDVLTTRETTDQPIAALGDRLLTEAEHKTGASIPFRPRIKVFATVAEFRDATGEPGWVAASTKGETIRLQPSTALRARGVLETTLRHEMLHLAVEREAHARAPLWFREGLVLWLADPVRPAARAVAMPDRALTSPRSEAEMRSAYASVHGRVRALGVRHGKEQLLRWLREGLPESPAGRR